MEIREILLFAKAKRSKNFSKDSRYARIYFVWILRYAQYDENVRFGVDSLKRIAIEVMAEFIRFKRISRGSSFRQVRGFSSTRLRDKTKASIE